MSFYFFFLAEGRRTSTLGLELEQAREHIKIITQSSHLDRETFIQRTRECADLRDQILMLRKVTNELERGNKRTETSHETILRTMTKRVHEAQTKNDEDACESCVFLFLDCCSLLFSTNQHIYFIYYIYIVQYLYIYIYIQLIFIGFPLFFYLFFFLKKQVPMM